MDLGERLKQARKNAKLSQVQLAEAVGIKQSTISQLEKGLMQSSTHLPALAKALGVNSYWLQTGMEKPEAKEPVEPSTSLTPNLAPVKARMAPVLSWVQAGNFTNVQAVDMSEVSEWLPLPEDECSNCFFLKVQGLSNYPDFMEGDYIVVNPDAYYSDMQSGDIIVVRRGEDATFKKLVIETDGTRYLQALNPDFKPNVIQLDDQCHFVGQVVDCVRYVYRAKLRTRKS
ncbi:XRE family transcriptional regulator [Acinetobacter radioresistens]|uniref:LexA family protein n=1 Tax=Acinetobacter radioresistens TaxID=40216 RepID=UPI003212B988